ncbi:MAG: helix-turn-helix domain-containing protein [Candidatus Hodarchaeota archaeon]
MVYYDRSKKSKSSDLRKNSGLGPRIRKLRTSKKISLEKLSKIAKLTPSNISQVERNLTNPSIPALRKIGAALGVPVFYFFMDEEIDESLLIVRSQNRKKLLEPDRNISFELLSPNLNMNMEVIELKIEPRLASSDELFTHDGEEACVVLEGELTIQLGEQEYVLSKGDCIQFNSGIPHRYINKKDSLVKVITVHTPPSF